MIQKKYDIRKNLNFPNLGIASMTKTKPIVAISLAGVFAIGMLFSPVFAGGHLPLTIEKYELEWDEFKVKKVKITVDDKIPDDGSAFGYGAILKSGDALLTTTHPGVEDSEDQLGDPFNPVWHNHVVALTGGEDDTHPCGIDNVDGAYTEILDLTWASPGEAKVKKDKAEIKNAPMGPYVGQLAGTPLSITAPENIVASFTLRPVNDDGETSLDWTHVCVENLTTVFDELPTWKIKGEL